MFRLLVALVTVLTLVSAASQTAAQEVEPCPAGDVSLVATPSAAMIAALEASPPASPPAEPYGSPSPTATGSPTTAETCLVVIDDFQFMPPVIRIPAGTSVVWSNEHGIPHTATADDFSWDTGVLSPTDTSAPIVFDTPGSIPYHCEIHAPMFGMIEVE